MCIGARGCPWSWDAGVGDVGASSNQVGAGGLTSIDIYALAGISKSSSVVVELRGHLLDGIVELGGIFWHCLSSFR